MKRLVLVGLLVTLLGGAAYGVTRVSKADCCCDFSDGKIVCRITGQELSRCCCK